MKINYWNCKYSYAEEQYDENAEMGYECNWYYYCDHPNSKSPYCLLDNKYDDEKEDCKLLDTPVV